VRRLREASGRVSRADVPARLTLLALTAPLGAPTSPREAMRVFARVWLPSSGLDEERFNEAKNIRGDYCSIRRHQGVPIALWEGRYLTAGPSLERRPLLLSPTPEPVSSRAQ
jgi:hypothetical protein